MAFLIIFKIILMIILWPMGHINHNNIKYAQWVAYPVSSLTNQSSIFIFKKG